MSGGLVTGVDLVFDSAAASMTPDVARWLSEYRPTPELEAKLEEYAERNTEGLLSEDELEGYSALVVLGDIFSILKLRARKFLATKNGV